MVGNHEAHMHVALQLQRKRKIQSEVLAALELQVMAR
jgi:hypothetical protein